MTTEQARSRCWAEIDLDALRHNYRAARALLAPQTRVIPVLKGNAYGCGIPQTARALFEEGARLFAVATVTEGLILKQAVPGADALVLGLTGDALIPRAIQSGLLLTAFSLEEAEKIQSAAARLGLISRVHIKIDTGLHRLGLDPETAVSDVQRMLALQNLRAEGLYTHLALHERASDEKQIAILDRVRRESGFSGLCHALDSIGMVRYPSWQMDAVRPGAWLYGVCPYRYARPQDDRPVVSLFARVAQVRRVGRGEHIGYDDDHFLTEDRRVATLSVGYADGYPRLNNAGFVRIRGKSAPVLGLVCMDQMMVDVTEIPGARPGDPVTLLGEGVDLATYAETARLNRNDALSRIGRRVPRVYREAGREFAVDETESAQSY